MTILATANAQSSSQRDKKHSKERKGLPPNMAKPGDKEMKTENGVTHFGSDVTGHTKPTPKSGVDVSKASKVDPRVKENERKRAEIQKKKALSKKANH